MRYFRYRDLRPKFGITFSRQHLRRLIAAGKFPPPVHLGPGTVAWLEEDLLEFGRRILAERDQRSIAWRDAEGGDADRPPDYDGVLIGREATQTETPLREDASPRRRRSGHD